MTRYFEDYKVGETFSSVGRTVTEADISIAMGIARYVEPVMIDEEYAKNTIFKGRIGPGRLTLFLMGGILGTSGLFDLEAIIALVGLNNIKFSSPLRAGDTIKVEAEIIDKKETSKSDRGVIVDREVCKNQRGEVVAQIEGTHLVKRRSVSATVE